MHFRDWNDLYFDSIFTVSVLTDPIDNKRALIQAMAWRGTGDKPLPELMLTQFVDAYMQH